MGKPWWHWATTLVPALGAGVALALPWSGSFGPLHVIDGASVTNTGDAVDTGFELLAGYQLVVLVPAVVTTIVVALVWPRRTWLAAGATGILACLISFFAFASLGRAVGSVLLFAAGAVLLTRVAYELAGRRANPVLAVLVLGIPTMAMLVPELGSPARTVRQVVADRFDDSTRLVPVNEHVAVAHAGEVSLVDGDRLVPLARVEDPAVTVLGVVRGRLVYYRADAFEVRVVPLAGGEPAVVTDVIGVDSMTVAGTVLLRTAGVVIPTLRRLDVITAEGRRSADTAEPAPVPGIRPLLETDDEKQPMRFQEHPRTGQIVAVDNNEFNRAALVGAEPGATRWQPLTGAGGHRDCFGVDMATAPLVTVDALAPDGADGWWLHAGGRATLVHVGGDGYVRPTASDLALPLPHALMTGQDGNLYLVAEDGLWRTFHLEDRLEAPSRAPDCVPYPVVAGPVRLEPVDGDQPAADTVPDGSGGTWQLRLLTRLYQLEHRDARGDLLDRRFAPSQGGRLWVDLSGGEPFVGRCPPTRLVDGHPTTPAPIPVANPDRCWDGLAIARDGRGWAVVDGRLYSFGPEGVVAVTAGGVPGGPVALRLVRGEPPESLPLPSPSLALDPAGRPVVLVEDILFVVSDQGKLIVVGQDERLRGMTLVTTEDGVLAMARDGTPHRLGY